MPNYQLGISAKLPPNQEEEVGECLVEGYSPLKP